MGNQTSHSANSKNDQAHIKLLLDKWSTEEKKHLEQLLKDTAILDSQQVIQQCHENLPTFFDKQLEQVFDLYITQQGSTSSSNNDKPSTTITSRQFLDTLHSLIDGTTIQSGTFIQPSEAFLNLFTLANQHYQLSFKTFISLIVKVGIRLWFTDSGLKVDIFDKEEKKGQEDNAYQQQQIRLVNTLLYSAGYLEQQKKQQDDMDWLEEEDDDDKKGSDNNKGKKKTALDIWAQQIDQQQPFQKDQDENDSTFTSNFFSWYEQTKGFKLLFHLVVKCYYFGYERLGKSTMDQLHSLRIKHERSPSIQQQTFSNLFTPYDYFYLSLQLPQNALSWSAIEKTQRKIKNNDDVTHQLIYSSRHHGNSWQRFVQSIGQQGATLLVIKTKNDGAVFGGYTDEPWQLMTDWYGTSLNFLYQLSGHYTPWNMFGVWNATSINDHYQYLCWGKKSLPNGLGKEKERNKKAFFFFF